MSRWRFLLQGSVRSWGTYDKSPSHSPFCQHCVARDHSNSTACAVFNKSEHYTGRSLVVQPSGHTWPVVCTRWDTTHAPLSLTHGSRNRQIRRVVSTMPISCVM
ncbi:hypothetical protein ACHAW6_009589 [Cyclotella cf. meneghiniana]